MWKLLSGTKIWRRGATEVAAAVGMGAIGGLYIQNLDTGRTTFSVERC